MHRERDKTMLLNVLCIVCCCYFTILSAEAFDLSFIGVLVSGTNYRKIASSIYLKSFRKREDNPTLVFETFDDKLFECFLRRL